jgi:multiple sugar transport system substrate-binding protein
MEQGNAGHEPDGAVPGRRISRRELLRKAAAGTAAAAGASYLASPLRPRLFDEARAAVPPRAQQTVDFTFLEFFTGELWTGLFQGIVADFEKQYPNIKWVGIPVNYNQLPAKFLTLTAGGDPPDGTSIDNITLPSMAARGVVKDLASYVSSTHYDLSAFYPARLKNGQWLGKQYGIPIDLGSSAIYYNKKAFDEQHMGYPQPTWSYDDYVKAAVKLTLDAKGKNPTESGFDPSTVKQWGFSFDYTTYRFYYIYTGYNGAQYFNPKVSQIEFGDPKSTQSLDFFLDMINVHHCTPTATYQNGVSNNNTTQPFTSGLYAMQFAWIGLIGWLHQAGVKVTDYDTVNLPRTPTAKQEVGGQTFVISKNSQHADAAWSWIEFMTGEYAQKALGASGSWFPGQARFADYAWPKDHKPAHFFESFYQPIEQYGLAEWWFTQDWPRWQTYTDTALVDIFSNLKTIPQATSYITQGIGSDISTWRKSI